MDVDLGPDPQASRTLGHLVAQVEVTLGSRWERKNGTKGWKEELKKKKKDYQSEDIVKERAT